MNTFGHTLCLSALSLLLVIPSAARAADYAEAAYDVGGLMKLAGGELEPEILESIVMNFTGEDKWDDPATAKVSGGKLVVKQTAEIQRLIKGLLEELALGLSGKGKTVADWRKLDAKQKKRAVKERSKADKKVYEVLARICEVNFDATPFADVVGFLNQITGVKFTLAAEAQDLIDAESPVVTMTKEARLGELIAMLLSCEALAELTFTVVDGGVVFGTTYELREMSGRIYDVRALVKQGGVDADLLIEELETRIADEEGSIEFVAGLLLVRKSAAGQDRVLQILETIRDRKESR